MQPDDVVATTSDVEIPAPRMPGARSICTRSGFRYQRQHFQIFDFFFFATALAQNSDQARLTAAKALANAFDEHKQDFERIKNNPRPAFNRLHSFSEYQSESMVIRLVDNYLAFLSESIQSCMLKKPELLSSKEQVRTEDILRFASRKDLIDFLVNRKINHLSYGGLKGIEKFLTSRLGLSLANTSEQRDQINIAIELRNIYTHNRGVVNELFMSRLASTKHDYGFREGERFHADYDEVVKIANGLFDSATRLDSESASKFEIQRKMYSTWMAGNRRKRAK